LRAIWRLSSYTNSPRVAFAYTNTAATSAGRIQRHSVHQRHAG
jgi:hypothetical protein